MARRVSLRRLIGCAIVLVLVASALFASCHAARPRQPPRPDRQTYIGHWATRSPSATRQQKFDENLPDGDAATAFEGGYVDAAGKKLATRNERRQLARTVNLGCPGEMSDGLIGQTPLLGGGQTRQRSQRLRAVRLPQALRASRWQLRIRYRPRSWKRPIGHQSTTQAAGTVPPSRSTSAPTTSLRSCTHVRAGI